MQSHTVVGIAPPDFQYGVEADVTVPIGLQAERFVLPRLKMEFEGL